MSNSTNAGTGGSAVPGFRFLQTPGPSNTPDLVLRSMSAPTIDHRGPEFELLTHEVLAGLRRLIVTEHPVVLFPGSGTGAWEAALVNTLSPGDAVLLFGRGHFANGWAKVARGMGLHVDVIEGDWRRPITPDELAGHLEGDTSGKYKAVLLVHCETSTGVITDIRGCRKAIDAVGHPALLLVDTISSFASVDYRHDEWGADVTIGGSQKGLMLPPGLSFNAVSPKALNASKSAGCPRSYWDWGPVIESNRTGRFPHTPPTNLLFGLRTAIGMLEEEGMDAVFARHQRHSQATRAAVEAWGLETVCEDPNAHSGTLTGVMVPESFDERDVRRKILDRFGVSLGAGLGQLEGRAFRIGHLGAFNDAMLIGVLGAVELGLREVGVVDRGGGVAAALEVLRT